MFGIQFYPTPENLAKKMVDKVKWDDVQFVLEPSAGKGDLIDAVRKPIDTSAIKREDYEKEIQYEIAVEKLKKTKHISQIECVEIDNDLASVLEGKHLYVHRADFLEWVTFTRYDLIIMNPPFMNGDKHLLKAIELMKQGGQIVCILNAETIRNPYSVYRQDLVNKLNEYHADIEYLYDTFVDAENKTDVEIALIYIYIPKVQYDFDMLGGMNSAEIYDGGFVDKEQNEIMTNDVIGNILKQYQREAELGLQLLDDFDKVRSLIPNAYKDENNKFGYSDYVYKLINVVVHSSEEFEYREKMSNQNLYLRELRFKYWSILFQQNEISRLLTNNMRDYFARNIQEMRNYDFSLSNIKELQLKLSQNMNASVEDAIVKQFDKLTYEHSLGKNTNVHYYNGWVTNNAFKINKKVIIPFYGIMDGYYNGKSHWNTYKIADEFDELEKIFTYLNGGVKNYDDIRTILINRDFDDVIECAFFRLELKKKGTVHVYFTNEELLKKFNIFAGKKKGFLPDDYGSKNYRAMNDKEKKLVKEFEGEKSYEETYTNRNYYLAQPQMLAIGTSE